MDKMISYKLYFGRDVNYSDGSVDKVSDDELSRFLRLKVDPTFNDYTLTIGIGRWEGSNEKVTILEILKPLPPRGHNGVHMLPGSIQNIVNAYKDSFYQKAVMVVVTPALVTY
jgi:hypothetical protein